MTSIELPLWAFESLTYGIAAVVFGTVVAPLSYWLGVRDRERNAFKRGFLKGLRHKKVSPFDGEV